MFALLTECSMKLSSKGFFFCLLMKERWKLSYMIHRFVAMAITLLKAFAILIIGFVLPPSPSFWAGPTEINTEPLLQQAGVAGASTVFPHRKKPALQPAHLLTPHQLHFQHIYAPSLTIIYQPHPPPPTPIPPPHQFTLTTFSHLSSLLIN